jgi:hypothetical protein
MAATLKIAVTVATAMGGSVLAAGPATAAGACSANAPRSTAGGVYVSITCSSPTAFIDGYGSNSTDANREALLLRQFQLNVGPKCSGSSSRAVTGGFSVAMTCSSPTNFLDAFGTTLTDAATEARLLEALDPRRGCTHTSLRRVSSGFEVSGHCTSPTVFFSGIGDTVTGAAQNARLASGVG